MDLNKLRRLAGLPEKAEAIIEKPVEETPVVLKEEEQLDESYSLEKDVSQLVDNKDFKKGPTSGPKVWSVSVYDEQNKEMYIELYSTEEKASERYNDLDQALGNDHSLFIGVTDHHVG
jgi:hypothetical protein